MTRLFASPLLHSSWHGVFRAPCARRTLFHFFKKITRAGSWHGCRARRRLAVYALYDNLTSPTLHAAPVAAMAIRSWRIARLISSSPAAAFNGLLMGACHNDDSTRVRHDPRNCDSAQQSRYLKLHLRRPARSVSCARWAANYCAVATDRLLTASSSLASAILRTRRRG